MFILTGLYCAERILCLLGGFCSVEMDLGEGGREGGSDRGEGIETEGEGKRSRGFSGTSTEDRVGDTEFTFSAGLLTSKETDRSDNWVGAVVRGTSEIIVR